MTWAYRQLQDELTRAITLVDKLKQQQHTISREAFRAGWYRGRTNNACAFVATYEQDDWSIYLRGHVREEPPNQ